MKEFITLISILGTPLLVSYVKNPNWKDWQKFGLAVLVSLVLGASACYIDGTFDVNNVAGTAGVIATLATGIYKAYFQFTPLNTGLEQRGPFNSTPPSDEGST